MKFYAMQSKVNPNGVQEFFPVWFNKKKLLKALSDLGLLTNWKYMKNYEWDTDVTGEIARYFVNQGWKVKVADGWSVDDIAQYDIDFMSDDVDIDKLDGLIDEYYSSCTDFFLASTDNRQQQFQFIAEMIAEQEWNFDASTTCELNANQVKDYKHLFDTVTSKLTTRSI